MKKIKVLIVDDSAVVRQTLKEILESDSSIKVIATASDPFVAAGKIRNETPDVITLDVEMPRMDGITFLHKIMSQRPIPVVMCFSLTGEGCETTLKALEYGAVDIITKPRIGSKKFFEESRIRICNSVKAAALARVKAVSARQGIDSAGKPVPYSEKKRRQALRSGQRRSAGLPAPGERWTGFFPWKLSPALSSIQLRA